MSSMRLDERFGFEANPVAVILGRMIGSRNTKMVAAGLRVKKLIEATGVLNGVDPGLRTISQPGGETDHARASREALTAAGNAVWNSHLTGKLEIEEALRRLKALSDSHRVLRDAPDEGDGPDATPDPAAEESRRREFVALVCPDRAFTIDTGPGAAPKPGPKLVAEAAGDDGPVADPAGDGPVTDPAVFARLVSD